MESVVSMYIAPCRLKVDLPRRAVWTLINIYSWTSPKFRCFFCQNHRYFDFPVGIDHASSRRGLFGGIDCEVIQTARYKSEYVDEYNFKSSAEYEWMMVADVVTHPCVHNDCRHSLAIFTSHSLADNWIAFHPCVGSMAQNFNSPDDKFVYK